MFYYDAERETSDISDDSSFTIHFFDVGEGDSTLVECDGHYMLIDGGNPSYSSFLYSYLKKRDIKYIDYIVCTHEHEDNVYGHLHDEVMDRIEKYVAQIYRTDLNGEITCISDGKEISMYFEGHNYDRTNESENYNKDSRMGE